MGKLERKIDRIKFSTKHCNIMFSGIHSLLFGKKHHKHRGDDSMDDKSQVSTENDFVILERRHSDEYDKNSALYPDLDPSKPPSSNLPYAISPSLPDLRDAGTSSSRTKEESKVDMLQGVPFVLSSQLLLFDDDHNRNLVGIRKSINDLKESGEESFLEDFNYDFELEHSIFSEYE